jgi:hypothetical protein
MLNHGVELRTRPSTANAVPVPTLKREKKGRPPMTERSAM